MDVAALRSSAPARAVGLVGICTLLLTLSFVGLLGMIAGATEGITDRFPYYVLVMAAVFVTGVLVANRFETDGRTTLLAAVGFGLVAFVLATLSGEGLVYTARFPSDVFGSQLIVYVLAAALIGTGITLWLLNNWRELVDEDGSAGEQTESDDS